MKLNNWQETSAKLGGASRSLVFKLWATGELGSVKVGKLRFSTDDQIAHFITQQSSGGAA